MNALLKVASNHRHGDTGGNPERDKKMLLRRYISVLALAALLAIGSLFDWRSREAQAQHAQHRSQLDLDYSLPAGPGRKLRKVRRPPLMPPTPKDFGPHFDFPAGGSANFNCGPGYGYYCGAPSDAPYLH